MYHNIKFLRQKSLSFSICKSSRFAVVFFSNGDNVDLQRMDSNDDDDDDDDDNVTDSNTCHLLYNIVCLFCLVDFISALKNIQIQSQSTKFQTITNTMNTMFTKVIK